MSYLDEAVTKSLDEFMECYKVVDKEEIYSNGTEFVPIFRVKQWEEYNDKGKEIERLHSIIKEVRDNLENSIKSINEKLRSNKEPFEVIDGRIQYINDYRVVRLKAFRTKCKELLEILDKENKK